MPRGNPSPKLAITVDPEIHGEIVKAAAREGMSVSAWMSDAARHALKIRAGLAAVDEWQKENGYFTEEELAESRKRVLEQLRPRRKVRRSA